MVIMVVVTCGDRDGVVVVVCVRMAMELVRCGDLVVSVLTNNSNNGVKSVSCHLLKEVRRDLLHLIPFIAP